MLFTGLPLEDIAQINAYIDDCRERLRDDGALETSITTRHIRNKWLVIGRLPSGELDGYEVTYQLRTELTEPQLFRVHHFGKGWKE